MVSLTLSMVAYVRAFFVSRHKLALEAAALRQQLAVPKWKGTRFRLHRLDRFSVARGDLPQDVDLSLGQCI